MLPHLHRFFASSSLWRYSMYLLCAPHCWIIFCWMFPFLICKLRIFMWRSLINKYHAACCSVFTFLVPTTNGCIDIKNLLVLFYSSRFPFFQDHVYNFMCIRWRRYSSETFWFEIRCSILYLFIFKWSPSKLLLYSSKILAINATNSFNQIPIAIHCI